MAVFQSEDRARLRRVLTEQAISLAMKSRWQEAVDVNKQLLEQYPKDVDALNRLGKGQMELGHYAESREAYGKALKLDPINTIAGKNLQRLAKLEQEGLSATAPSPVDPSLFIEESGRTTLTVLVDVTRPEALAKLDAGDRVELQPRALQVVVMDDTGQQIGRLEPKLAKRVLKLLEMDNRYAAAITSVDESNVRIIIRETYRDPRMGTRPSFPTLAAGEAMRGYIKAGVLKYDLEEDDYDEDDEPTDVEDVEAEGNVEPEIGVEEPHLDEGVLRGDHV